jgi:16S rRNA (guanine527-N7)-methyltransferase
LSAAHAPEERLRAILSPAARSLGISLGDAMLGSLSRFASLLLAWNARINLTGAHDLETLAREHLADALALVSHLPAAGSCVDVGSGAGLPGLVLAICRPDLRFQLLEPSQKRRAFLAAVVRDLGIGNVTISAERLGAHARRVGAAYDFAVSRAVFELPTWLATGRGLVRPGGAIAGLAGREFPPGVPTTAETHPYDVGAGSRAIVLVRV